MEFIALLSSGKGTWGQVAGLINRYEWEKIVLVTSDFFKSTVKKFHFNKKTEVICIDFNQSIKLVIEQLKEKLKNKFHGTEVAVSIASGSGKEHTALISALLQLPVGIKFVVLTKEGLTEL